MVSFIVMDTRGGVLVLMKGMKEIPHLVEGFLAHPKRHCICARPELISFWIIHQWFLLSQEISDLESVL